ncbi:hypothetical protein [Thalassoglobus sp.]|uniref:hypothetical protein n=1 Tax=Thalassoglobus sp. TaxID=2795869 RepID=UPI003AA8C6B4
MPSGPPLKAWETITSLSRVEKANTLTALGKIGAKPASGAGGTWTIGQVASTVKVEDVTSIASALATDGSVRKCKPASKRKGPALAPVIGSSNHGGRYRSPLRTILKRD